MTGNLRKLAPDLKKIPMYCTLTFLDRKQYKTVLSTVIDPKQYLVNCPVCSYGTKPFLFSFLDRKQLKTNLCTVISTKPKKTDLYISWQQTLGQLTYVHLLNNYKLACVRCPFYIPWPKTIEHWPVYIPRLPLLVGVVNNLLELSVS